MRDYRGLSLSWFHLQKITRTGLKKGERHVFVSRDPQGDRKGPRPSTSSTPALTMTLTGWGMPFMVGAGVEWRRVGTLAVALVPDIGAKTWRPLIEKQGVVCTSAMRYPCSNDHAEIVGGK